MKKMLAPLLLTLLAFSAISVAYAREEGSRTAEQQTDTREHRDVDIFSSDHLIVIRSSVQNGNVENHFGLLVSTFRLTERFSEHWFENGLVIHVAFSQETELGADVENEAFLYMRIAYLSLTEFEDTNGNGGLDAGDTPVNAIPLNMTYAPLKYETITSQDGQQGWRIMAQTQDGMFAVTADIFRTYAVVDNTIVPPTATKITTIINNFPFQSTSSKVALQVLAISKTVIEHETPTTEERIRVRSATAEGFFTWTPTATVDGQTVNVVASTTRLERPRWLINLAYPQVGGSSQILHDPILGFDFGATPLLTSSLLIGAAIAATAMFGVLVYLGRRQLAGVFTPKPIGQ